MSEQKKILVVEDEVIVAQNIRKGLERSGYAVIGPVGDAERAIQTALEKNPDLILMDISLDGGRDGVEVVRELNRHMDVPVIYITAHGDSKTVERAKQTAPFGYLHKPFSENEIHSTIEMALYKHETQRKINRNENIMSTTLRSIGDALVASDANFHVNYVNPIAEDLFGKPEADLLGEKIESLCSFTHEKNGEPVINPCRLVIDSGERVHLPDDCVLVNFRNKRIPVSGSFSVILNEKDQPAGVVIVLRDVTREWKEEEAKSIQSRLESVANEIRIRLIRDAQPDISAILGLLGRSVSAERAYLCLFPVGYETECDKIEIIDWLHEDRDPGLYGIDRNHELIGNWLNNRISDGKPIIFTDIDEMPDEASYEKKCLKKADVKSMVAFPFRSWNVSYLGLIGFDWIGQHYKCSDIEKQMLAMMTELIATYMGRMKAEEMVRSSENRFRTLIQNSTDIITVLDVNRTFQYVSPSVKKILGYEPEELLGKDAFQLIHQDDRAIVEKNYKDVLLGLMDEQIVEHRFKHKKGHWVYLESVGSNLINSSEEGGLVVNTRDISDRKQVERDLISARDTAEEMNQVKTALLANMSHEMRTPLTGILGFASILESDLPEGEAREMAMRINLSGRRLLETIESILDLAKLESEKVEIQLERVNIVEEISRALEVHSRPARHKELNLRVQTELAELYIDIDRQLFNRVMYNLISNALKYTNEGEVSVHISRLQEGESSYAKVDVQDTGVGISSEFLPKVFDEFQQESKGLSRKFEGSGLGLTITRKLVEMIGGNITVYSKKDEGSLFSIRLPLKEEKNRKVEEQGFSEKAGDEKQKPRILLVEDDYDSSVITRLYLGQVSDVKIVDSGEKALEELQSGNFNLVIMDISLGEGMDGVSTLKVMRSNLLLVDVPAIALTAHALSGDADFYLKEGFAGYLSKPFKKDDLLQLVGKLLKI